jgi:microcystin-dependent protein
LAALWENAMNPFIGEIRTFGFNFAPEYWLQCNGQLLPISQNTALFSLLGTMYGGDGRTTFGLPDMPPVSESGPYYCIAQQGVFPHRP